MKLNVITNSRPTSNMSATLIAGCTSGQIKVTEKFAEILGLLPEDYLAVGKDADGNIFCFAGSDEGQAKGNKLAKSGNYLSMSSQNTWDILGGDTNFNTSFDVATDEDGEQVIIEDEDGTYIKLGEPTQEAKVERKSKTDEDGNEVEEEEEA